MAFFSTRDDCVVLTVRLQPAAAAERILGIVEDAAGDSMLKVAVTAPPEKGKANAALVKLLSKRWKIPKSEISIIKGVTERRKTVHIAVSPDRLRSQLNTHFEGFHD